MAPPPPSPAVQASCDPAGLAPPEEELLHPASPAAARAAPRPEPPPPSGTRGKRAAARCPRPRPPTRMPPASPRTSLGGLGLGEAVGDPLLLPREKRVDLGDRGGVLRRLGELANAFESHDVPPVHAHRPPLPERELAVDPERVLPETPALDRHELVVKLGLGLRPVQIAQRRGCFAAVVVVVGVFVVTAAVAVPIFAALVVLVVISLVAFALVAIFVVVGLRRALVRLVVAIVIARPGARQRDRHREDPHRKRW